MGLARRAIDVGRGAVLKGAKVGAVAGFGAGRVMFGVIVGVVDAAMEGVGARGIGWVVVALGVGDEARGFVEGRIGS
jgi:hypothetical protein